MIKNWHFALKCCFFRKWLKKGMVLVPYDAIQQQSWICGLLIYLQIPRFWHHVLNFLTTKNNFFSDLEFDVIFKKKSIFIWKKKLLWHTGPNPHVLALFAKLYTNCLKKMNFLNFGWFFKKNWNFKAMVPYDPIDQFEKKNCCGILGIYFIFWHYVLSSTWIVWKKWIFWILVDFSKKFQTSRPRCPMIPFTNLKKKIMLACWAQTSTFGTMC